MTAEARGAARPPDRRARPRSATTRGGSGTSRCTLAVTDFKLRFFGSVLGYLWQLMRPLLLFGVLYVVFTQVVRLGAGVELYPVALLLGIVLYTFFSEATSGALTASSTARTSSARSTSRGSRCRWRRS